MTRRDFLRNAGAAGGLVALPGLALASAGGAAPPRGAQAGSRGVSRPISTAPLIVVTQTPSTDDAPRSRAWGYIAEILERAGLFFEAVSPRDLEGLPGRKAEAVVVLAGDLALSSVQRQALVVWVKDGGSLIGIGGTSGLEEVFGVSSGSPLAEGWLKPAAASHPILAGLRSSLHVFGGCTAKRSTATALADVELANGTVRAGALLENVFGQGRAILLGPDLIFSVVHLQQGLHVLQDGKPAPDESAPLNDGVLKAEDGLVLDWRRDRLAPVAEHPPFFLEPVSDELRELILRAIFHAARQGGVPLLLLWYWPRGLPAVGHLSHDTDGNEPAKAEALREVMNRCGERSTWCILYPGGYPAAFYRALRDDGFEVALHYDAHTGGARTSWSKANFLFQQDWLRQEAGLRRVTSNKNHYTRWEGRLELLRWCEQAGIAVDQTRGPSKKGTLGFPLGGSQPYYPVDDEAAVPRRLKVLEVNLLTQDLVITCPAACGRPLLDSALGHHGVAHFLFHPAHILKPGVAEALKEVVSYGRERGLEWWTSEQIVEWETARRGVQARFEASGAVTLRAPQALAQATLLRLAFQPEPQPLTVNGTPAAPTRRTVHGFEFDGVQMEVAGELRVQG